MKSPRRVAVVAGSGLDLTGLLDEVKWRKPFEAFEGLPPASVSGHAGSFTQGTCGALPIILQQGRHHIYEGLAFEGVTATVRVLVSLGVNRIVFTNAAGGLKPQYKPGYLLAVDRLFAWPCLRWPEHEAEFHPTWIIPGCDAVGSYVWVHGPSYETRAEIKALQHMDAIGGGPEHGP